MPRQVASGRTGVLVRNYWHRFPVEFRFVPSCLSGFIAIFCHVIAGILRKIISFRFHGFTPKDRVSAVTQAGLGGPALESIPIVSSSLNSS